MQLELRGKPELLQQTATPTILVVDDEPVIRDLCARILKSYHILQAEHGEEALRILDHEKVDLVLVDVMMPIMNGLDLLHRIKGQDPEQLVIVMTGYADRDIILRALKAHANDFIHKPINLLQLKTSIKNALEKKTLHQELMQLKQLDRIKSEFLGLISHKLRTPTTSISLFIQNLSSGAIDLKAPEFALALDAVREESEYLAYLIQDLLYYSDIILNSSKNNTSREDLKGIANTVLSEKSQVMKQKGLTLNSSLAEHWPSVDVDRRRIAFALNALLDNAIKFTPKGGTITFSGDVDATEFIFVITDNGPGIPPEEVAKIFEKFYQVDPQHTGQIRGFGLGLFYARQFIRDHGGAISLSSTPGKGTEITVRLPRSLSNQP